jgi:hypothetical protein
MKALLACPIHGCLDARKSSHLMCLRHWRRVPKLLRSAVFDTFAEWGRAPLGEGGDARRRYIDARIQAIKAVEAKEAAEALP